jgi:hypothetical protein
LRGDAVSSTGEVVGAGCGVAPAEVDAVDCVDCVVLDWVVVDCVVVEVDRVVADVVDVDRVERVVRVDAEAFAVFGEALGAWGEDEAVGVARAVADAAAFVGPPVTACPRPRAPAPLACAAASPDAPRARAARPGSSGFARPRAGVAAPGPRPSDRWSADSTRSSAEDVATRIGPAVRE